MSRVLAVVGNAIMVHIHDVVVGDILGLFDVDESNATIIQRVERDGDKVRLHYMLGPNQNIPHSVWLDPERSAKMFVLDLKGERHGFREPVDA